MMLVVHFNVLTVSLVGLLITGATIKVFGFKCLNASQDCYWNGRSNCKGKMDYKGTKSRTKSGIPCQKWSSQKPHEHDKWITEEENYCRITEDAIGPWCFTMDSNVIWDYCFHSCPTIKIKFQLFDPAGVRSPLTYNGGTARIICTYDKEAPVRTERRIVLYEHDGSSRRLLTFAGEETTNINFNESIGGHLKNRYFGCAYGFGTKEVRMAPRYMDNILCNPTTMPPVICDKQKTYCQIAANGTAVCSKLNLAKQYCPGDHPMKFLCLCGNQYKIYTVLCGPFYSPGGPRIHFVSMDTGEGKCGRCQSEITFTMTVSPGNRNQTLMMAEWTYVNTAAIQFFGIFATKLYSKPLVFKCKVASNYKILLTDQVRLSVTPGQFDMLKIKEGIKALSSPSMVYISCSGHKSVSHIPVYVFSTQLLAFKLDRDLSYNITETRHEKYRNEVIVNLEMKATAGKGLYVCAAKDKGSCKPGRHSEAVIKPEVKCTYQEPICDIRFHIGLFGSSPIKQYVPLHIVIANWTINLTDTLIHVEVLDPNGMPSVLNYEGGKINVRCTYIGQKSKSSLKYLYLYQDDNKNKQIQVDGDTRDTKITNETSITDSLLNHRFLCTSTDNYQDAKSETIGNILCDPTKMPSMICSNPNEYCQYNDSGEATCAQIDYNRCKLAHPLRLSCGCATGNIIYSDFCGFFNYSHVHRIQLVAAVDSCDRCKHKLEFRFTASNKKPQTLIMAGWNSVNSVDLDFIGMMGTNIPDVGTTFMCKAGVNQQVIGEDKYNVPFGSNKLDMPNIKESIKNLSVPSMVYISCSGTEKDSNIPAYGFSTQLLAFRPDRDLTYTITEEKRQKMQHMVRIHLKVTAIPGKGLYACVTRDSKNCTPAEVVLNQTGEVVIQSKVTCKYEQPICNASFYIGLFGSSPKEMYVPLHNVIANWTINVTGLRPTKTKEKKKKKKKKKRARPIPWLSGVIGFIVVSIIVGVMIGVVLLVQWYGKRRKQGDLLKYRETEKKGRTKEKRRKKAKPQALRRKVRSQVKRKNETSRPAEREQSTSNISDDQPKAEPID